MERRVILALTQTKSIWAKIIVVILTMQNPFGGSGIQMETIQAQLKKREYHTNPHMKNGPLCSIIDIFIYLNHIQDF